jgi:Na+/melibiose symporter-like transporter
MASGESVQEPADRPSESLEYAPLPGELHSVSELERLDIRRNYWALVASQAAATGYLTLRSGFLGAIFEPVAPSVFWITFAVTAHRWLYPLAAPLVGRLSDKSSGKGGRRKPFMVWGLLVMGVASVLLGVGPRSYWPMVALVVIASLGWTAYRIPRFSATPDLFGQSMWAGMAVSLAVAGFLPNVIVQGLINRTWERSHATAFVIAGLFSGAAGLVVLVRLREPSSDQRATAGEASRMELGDRMRYIVSHRNLLVLLAAGGCISVAASPVAPLYVVYAGRVLGVGVRTVAAAGIYGGLAALPLIPVVAIVSARIDRKLVGMACAVLGTALAVGAYNTSSIVTLTAYGVVTSLIGIAIAVSLGTLLVVLFPREILAEVAGLWTAVTTIGSIAVSYAISAAIESTGNWRLLWLPLIIGCPASLLCLAFLDLPRRHRRPDISKLRSSIRTSLMAGVKGYENSATKEGQRPADNE